MHAAWRLKPIQLAPTPESPSRADPPAPSTQRFRVVLTLDPRAGSGGSSPHLLLLASAYLRTFGSSHASNEDRARPFPYAVAQPLYLFFFSLLQFGPRPVDASWE